MTLERVRRIARRRPEQEFILNRLYGAQVSPFFTVVCLRLGVTPDQVTIIGGALGLVAVGLLFLPLSWWSVVAVICLQLGYILDFADGQVARMTDSSSSAGSYLDWLTHLYIPVGTALAVAASVGWQTGASVWLPVGMLAAFELGAFAFSCKEHILIALARRNPTFTVTAPFHAALADDARPDDVSGAVAGSARPEGADGLSGRRHYPSVRAVLGEVMIYPGAAHLMTVAVLLDFVGAGAPFSWRGAVLLLWAALFCVHAPLTIRRNHALIRVLEHRLEEHSTAGDAP